ncbi:glycosyltransferase family 71 protein [Stemphylium lycopersici]|uniref:Glycosyltransferase family 71 protein n=1 Tax=Stemphylium lycopersici TaxID=183478 RepID=A0A364MYI2_STELY|nr:glycosyltransferase family 71 protein [Stemphylium lycopersici]RAR07365.1 glycosyltransferase family 71 protein [Stemphylium lycopersici]
MLVTTPHFISSVPRLLVIPLFLLLCGIFFLPRQYHGSAAYNVPILTGKNLTEASSTFGEPVQEFWSELATALLDAQPQCEPLELDDEGFESIKTFLPLEPHKKHPDRLVNFTDTDETALFRAHYAMRTSAQDLAPKVPFSKGTTGIVTTANAQYMPIFLVSLRMLRRTGCDLPMEVFIDNWSKYDATICDTVLPSLNARCVVLSNIYETATDAKPPHHFQYKAFAILFSSFQHVLFLDSDAFPVTDPAILFSTAPYTTHGLVTWPDFWAQTISAHFYHIAAIPEVASQSRLSTESGQLLINKDLHRETLLMMVYYNYYGPDYYYILFSQGSPGAGDKETFVQAALAVDLPYYQIRTAPGALGRFVNGTFKGTGIAQAHPHFDYKYLAPMRTHIHEKALWQDADLKHPDPAKYRGGYGTRKVPGKPRPFFIHQNSLKLDPAKVLDDPRTFDVDGKPHRMWGGKEAMETQLGYDVEQRMWDVIAVEGCREDEASEQCRRLRSWYKEVFG